jgi:uncharacterized protein DUF6602
MSDDKIIDLHGIFLGLQTEMVMRLNTARQNIPHAPSMGDEGEGAWLEMLQHFLPKRYHADKAFVIDSKGRISEQMDVVIFDRQYSPFMAKFKDAHYIPAESVYAVLEVKQDLTAAHLEYAGQKAASVRALHRTTMPIRYVDGTPHKREPLPILAGLLCHASGWNPAFGKPFASAINARSELERLNFGCCLEAGSFFVDWKPGTPVVRFSGKDASLVSFVLGLIDSLQQLGTVPALDLNAYLSPLLNKSVTGSATTKKKRKRKP